MPVEPKARTLTREPLQRRMVEYLGRHIGAHLHYATVAEELGVKPDQVTNWLSHKASREPQFGVSRVNRGVYVYRPGGEAANGHRATTTKTLFELIGRAKDGSLVIEADDGTLYKATEL